MATNIWRGKLPSKSLTALLQKGSMQRQIMLQQKQAFGTGIDPEFPTTQQIEQYEDDREGTGGQSAPGSQ